MRKFITLLTLIIITLSCTSTEVKQSIIDNHYRLRMKIEVNGVNHYGMALLKNKRVYNLKFTSIDKMDFFALDTCANSIVRYDAGGKIFNKRTTKVFLRRNEIEREKNCDAKIQVLSDKTKYTAGYIVFENDQDTLEGEIICGSKTYSGKGATVCTIPHQTYFRIKFKEDVEMKSVSCGIIPQKRRDFTLKTELGFCNYVFVGKNSTHRLVTYGHNRDVVR